MRRIKAVSELKVGMRLKWSYDDLNWNHDEIVAILDLDYIETNTWRQGEALPTRETLSQNALEVYPHYLDMTLEWKRWLAI